MMLPLSVLQMIMRYQLIIWKFSNVATELLGTMLFLLQNYFDSQTMSQVLKVILACHPIFMAWLA